MKVVKKNNLVEDFDFEKIIKAVRKSAKRIGKELSDETAQKLKYTVLPLIHRDVVSVERLHEVVELSLSRIDMEIADSYRGYRNYRKDLADMMETVVAGVDKAMEERDRSNSNLNSVLFSARRTNASKILLAEMFETYFLTKEERQATKDGFIYPHDKDNRLTGTHNCCVIKAENIMDNGFNINGYFCKEPKDIVNAIGVLGDIIVTCASAEYGGFSLAEIDTTLSKYCAKSYDKWKAIVKNEDTAMAIVMEELENSIQALEFQLNTRESSRGDFPFTTFSFGKDTSFWGRKVAETILNVRMKGHGDDVKQIAIFPKLVFILRDDRANEELFNLAVKCSSKCLYPDFIPESKATPMGK